MNEESHACLRLTVQGGDDGKYEPHYIAFGSNANRYSLVPSCKGNATATDAERNETSSTREAGVISPVRSMTMRRAAHSATLLPNGQF
jgi:hypothetical protein